jgi:hypothetical protein
MIRSALGGVCLAIETGAASPVNQQHHCATAQYDIFRPRSTQGTGNGSLPNIRQNFAACRPLSPRHELPCSADKRTYEPLPSLVPRVAAGLAAGLSVGLRSCLNDWWRHLPALRPVSSLQSTAAGSREIAFLFASASPEANPRCYAITTFKRIDPFRLLSGIAVEIKLDR